MTTINVLVLQACFLTVQLCIILNTVQSHMKPFLQSLVYFAEHETPLFFELGILHLLSERLKKGNKSLPYAVKAIDNMKSGT